MRKRKTTTEQHLETTTVVDAFNTFVTSRQAMGVTKQTLIYYNKKLLPFIEWCNANGIPNIANVTAANVRTYIVTLQQRNLAPHTVHGHARAIKALLSFCVADGLLNAAPRFVMPKLPKDILAAFSREDVVRLLDACDDPRDRLIVLFLLDTGVRASEFVALNGSDLDLTTGAVMVRKGKGSKQRIVYLGARTRRELNRYWREYGKPASADPVWESLTTGNRLTGDGLRQLLQRLGNRAKVENCHPHTFRRTFALWSLRAGMDVFSLQRLMGHSDLQVLRRYLDQTDLDIATAHQQHGAIDAVLGRAV